MRFEVPQFIEIEDKIVGPFTWKQFVYIAGGAGAVFILYVLLPFLLFLIIAGPIVALSAGLAFYKHNNRPFSVLLEAMFRYVTNSRLYLWKKQQKQVASSSEISPLSNVYTPPSSDNSIASLSRKLEMNALSGKK